ncbi:hypothetical protein F9S46_24595 [Escherichia coli]|nr:hypothetical protein [Escherichia coli]
MAYNITIGNKTIEITESGYNILKAILEIEFSPPTVVSFCSLGDYSAHQSLVKSFYIVRCAGL